MACGDVLENSMKRSTRLKHKTVLYITDWLRVPVLYDSVLDVLYVHVPRRKYWADGTDWRIVCKA